MTVFVFYFCNVDSSGLFIIFSGRGFLFCYCFSWGGGGVVEVWSGLVGCCAVMKIPGCMYVLCMYVVCNEDNLMFL